MSEQQRWSRESRMGGRLSSHSSVDSEADSSAAGWSLCSFPLSVSEEELRTELSLLGFPSIPRNRLLQFKEDLEYLMRSRISSQASPGNGSDPGKENIPSSDSEQRSLWPALSDPEVEPQVQQCDSRRALLCSLANCGEKTVVPLTRKVLRKKSDGQVEVCNESMLSSEAECPEESIRAFSRTSHSSSVDCTKSFIRPPPYSLLEQYRQHSDPVGRYQEYKQSWDAAQGALEHRRRELRWRVRERMMSAPPVPLSRPLPTPNSYVIPTEKKRYGLRWAIRQDLVNGNIPRGGCS